MSINNAGPPAEASNRTRAETGRLRHRWGWIMAFGGLSAALGVIALLLVISATIASVYAIAIFMIIVGAAEIAIGLSAQTWVRFFLWIIGGALYMVVASLALAQPLLAAAIFTLALGVGMLAVGAMRIYFATRLNSAERSPVLFAAVVTALVGLVIVLGWPANSVVILGILLALDLLFWGVGWISFGWRLRRLA
ncbi:MAG: DUF308 domain-containing protein [Methylocella sp.]